MQRIFKERENKMKILILIILSPFVLICGIISIAIIFAIIKWIINLILGFANAISDYINKKE